MTAKNASHGVGPDANTPAVADHADRDEDGLVVPEMVRNAPAPLRWLMKVAYCPLLSEDDTSRERLLKAFVVVMVPSSGAPLSNAALTLLTSYMSDRGMTPAAWCLFAAMLILIAAWYTIYLRVRMTKRVTEGSADVVNAATSFAVLIMALTDVDGPGAIAAMTILNLTLIAFTPRTVWWVLLDILIFFVGGYNSVVSDANRGALYHAEDGSNEYGLPLLAIPGVLDRGMHMRFAYYVMNLFVLCGGVVGVALRISSANNLAKRAEASATLAATISRALARYDTKSARAALEEAKAGDDADQALLGHFDTLIANLDSYRPHLPNWVVASAASSVDDGPAGTDGEDDEGSIDLDANDDHARSRSSDPRGEKASDKSSRNDSLRQSHRSGSSSTNPAHCLARPQRGSVASPGVVTAATVSLATVDLAFAPAAASGMQARLDAAVDRVHDLARGTYGAVHSFVGDRVTVSWNAASRVANPQAKAARFLARLAKHADNGDLGVGTGVTGATASGPALAHVAGLGDQRALFVSEVGDRAWVAGLDALRAQAAHDGAMLCDGRTRLEAEHCVHLSAHAALAYRAATKSATDVKPWSPPATVTRQDDIPADRLHVPHDEATTSSPAPPSDRQNTNDTAVDRDVRRLAAFRIVDSRDDGTDEWMYVLKDREAKAAEAECAETLQRWAAGAVATDDFVQTLEAQLRSQHGTGSTEDEASRAAMEHTAATWTRLRESLRLVSVA